MHSQRRRIGIRVGLFFACLMAVAAPAAAVSFSSGDGSGSMYVTAQYSPGYAAAGGYQSKSSGKGVYVSGLVIYDWAGDHICGRMIGNTSSTSSRPWTGTCMDYPGGSADGAKARICWDKLGYDPCGGWSATTW
ncbi:MAG: hypothetical protein ACRC0L_02085 [Angustibacter sp.]